MTPTNANAPAESRGVTNDLAGSQSVSSVTESPTVSPLRQAITLAGRSLSELTVLASQNDPFRVDTPARHRDGEWLAMQLQDLGLSDRKIHPRGLHYALIGRTKPDGTSYANNDADWRWLAGDAVKAARWLGYVDFDRIEDHRNTPPTITVFQQPDPYPYISVGVDVDIPDADDIVPRVGVLDFAGVQPYKIVMFGEKSSLADVLVPLAERYKADWYQPAGEISDSMMHTMVSVAAADGRPLVVLTFSDCDPAGWQMPISISRKLQAFKTGFFPEIDFAVYRVALMPDQVREYGLPSTPLKESERRAGKWRRVMGIEQTEIDALASLRPDLLRRIAIDALNQFYDQTLDGRVSEAHSEWYEMAQAALEDQLDPDRLGQIRDDAQAKLAAMRDEIDALNAALRIDVSDFMLPQTVIPVAELDAVHGLPLVDSRWDFAEQCEALKASRSYDGGAL